MRDGPLERDRPAETAATVAGEPRDCVTWGYSFSGHAVDLDALGEICQANDVRFVVNGSQVIGARP